MSKNKTCVHMYERVGNTTTFRCVLPRCTHFWDKKFLLGKEATCPNCMGTYVLTLEAMRRKKPNCGCRTKGGKLRESVKANLADFLGGILLEGVEENDV